jgi:hypothetical protein
MVYYCISVSVWHRLFCVWRIIVSLYQYGTGCVVYGVSVYQYGTGCVVYGVSVCQNGTGCVVYGVSVYQHGTGYSTCSVCASLELDATDAAPAPLYPFLDATAIR